MRKRRGSRLSTSPNGASNTGTTHVGSLHAESTNIDLGEALWVNIDTVAVEPFLARLAAEELVTQFGLCQISTLPLDHIFIAIATAAHTSSGIAPGTSEVCGRGLSIWITDGCR